MIPNIISLLRIVLLVPIIYAFSQGHQYLGLFGIALAAFTDFADGYIARRLNQATPLGAFLDQAADKIFVHGMFIYCYQLGLIGLAPVLTMGIRDALLLGLRLSRGTRKSAIPVKNLGKIKTTFQFICLFSLLSHQPVMLLVPLTVLLTVISAMPYLFGMCVPDAQNTNFADIFAWSIATACGIGYLPKMPGSWGTLFAVGLFLYCPVLTIVQYVSILTTTTFLGWWASTRTEKIIGQHDPSCIVIDEVVAMVGILVCIPTNITSICVAFSVFRFLDVTKLFPINCAEKLPGGLGIMADDLVAGGMTLMLFWFFQISTF